jgi:hypothetical protein
MKDEWRGEKRREEAGRDLGWDGGRKVRSSNSNEVGGRPLSQRRATPLFSREGEEREEGVLGGWALAVSGDNSDRGR